VVARYQRGWYQGKQLVVVLHHGKCRHGIRKRHTLRSSGLRLCLEIAGLNGGPEEFADYIRREADRWTKVAQAAGLRS
jgi:hypothetical protein